MPGVVAVMITVPLATGMDSTNDAMIQPIPGSSAPLTERMAQAASRQVSRMTTQHASAATGTGLGTRLYWKLPMHALHHAGDEQHAVDAGDDGPVRPGPAGGTAGGGIHGSRLLAGRARLAEQAGLASAGPAAGPRRPASSV